MVLSTNTLWREIEVVYLPDELSENAVIWVAEYSNNLSYTDDFDIWQYSKTGKLEGNGSKYVDLNFWYVKE